MFCFDTYFSHVTDRKIMSWKRAQFVHFFRSFSRVHLKTEAEMDDRTLKIFIFKCFKELVQVGLWISVIHDPSSSASLPGW